MFTHMPVAGLGAGAGVLVGQNLGADQPERAEKTGWLGVGLVTGFMVILSVAVWFWADDMFRMFNPEANFVQMGGTFLRIHIVSNLVYGLWVLLPRCLEGAGDTLPPMLTSLVTMWLVQIPLAYFLSHSTELGIYGIRWAIVSAMVMRAAVYAVYFKMGRWKRKRV